MSIDGVWLPIPMISLAHLLFRVLPFFSVGFFTASKETYSKEVSGNTLETETNLKKITFEEICSPWWI